MGNHQNHRLLHQNDDIPLDVCDKLELVAVETMDEVFACALSRVILPQNMNGAFTLEQLTGLEGEGEIVEVEDEAGDDEE